MATIRESARQYEDWLREQLHGDVLEQDFAKKHDKMRESAFVFLRATYWRWAETIFDVCPDLAGGTQVLAVGDIHIENYGTWRDVDGRLAWGVNDFDDAAEMPYVLDLVRLAASALLGSGRRRITDEEICAAILNGYRQGLHAPQPVVLDRDKLWLRDLVVIPERERAKFWKKIAAVKGKPAPERYLTAIADAMPERSQDFQSRLHVEVPVSEASAGRSGWVAPIGVALLLFEKPRRSWSRHGPAHTGSAIAGPCWRNRERPIPSARPVVPDQEQCGRATPFAKQPQDRSGEGQVHSVHE